MVPVEVTWAVLRLRVTTHWAELSNCCALFQAFGYGLVLFPKRIVLVIECVAKEDICFWGGRVEVTAVWRRLHNEELYALYSSPNIIGVIKSRRLR
jgi:hypothetical protein